MNSHQYDGSSVVRNQLRRYYEPIWKTWAKLTEGRNGTYPVAHQGIQRSGTNFLSQLLNDADYQVLNLIDPARNNPKHKHCRWQHDKSTIVMDRRYRNDFIANTVDEINKISSLPMETKHIVLFREPRDWLSAIFRWGIANGWFASENDFFQKGLHRAYLKEWHAFYAAWADIAERDPDQVMLLSFGNLLSDPILALAQVDRFMGVERAMTITNVREVQKVRHSKPMTSVRRDLQSDEIETITQEVGAFDWRYYTSPYWSKGNLR